MVDRKTHLEVLESLVAFDRPIAELTALTRRLPWDNDEELAVVGHDALVDVLTRYRRGGISAGDVEAWADLVEGREDLAFTPTSADVVHVLANPALEGELTEETVASLLARIAVG